nr:type IV secretory system conjugative DNA transfer family protein [Paracoccus halophilus]
MIMHIDAYAALYLKSLEADAVIAVMAELEKIATLFLQTDDASASSFLPNSRSIFVACGILAYEQGELTLGRIHKLAFGGAGDNNAKFAGYAKTVKDRSAKLIFQQLAATTEKTLSAYVSVLASAGMQAWANPHTCAVTDASDFDFSTFRKKPQTVYEARPRPISRVPRPLGEVMALTGEGFGNDLGSGLLRDLANIRSGAGKALLILGVDRHRHVMVPKGFEATGHAVPAFSQHVLIGLGGITGTAPLFQIPPHQLACAIIADRHEGVGNNHVDWQVQFIEHAGESAGRIVLDGEHMPDAVRHYAPGDNRPRVTNTH